MPTIADAKWLPAAETWDDHPNNDYCRVLAASSTPGEPHLCGSVAVAVAVTGCVHEHIDTVPYCAPCLEALQAGGLVCDVCEFIDDHECVVRVISIAVNGRG